MSFNSPIETYGGYLIKRDDMFSLGEIIKGGKVRQCLRIVYENLDEIKSKYNGGLITGCGLPSPQSTIVSAVSKYFGLKCIVVSPIYDNSKVDVNRINVSLSQKLGAKIYGVGNPNPSGYKLDVKKLKDELGYYEIKFGMNSESVIDTTSHQVKNIPNELENLVVICGSGLNLLGILKGIVKYKKKVNNVYGITLSKFFDENKKLYYDNLVDKEKYKGQLHIIRSPYPYQRLKKTDIPFLDWTYESKAYSFMTENISPSTNTLFWVVGIRNYDLDNIVPIKWNKSKHEKKLDKERVKRKVVLKKSNIHNLKTNLTYHEIQSLSFTDLSNWVDDLRNEILYNWDVKNEPPVIGKSKEQIIKSFSKLRDYPIEDLFIEDENYPHHLGFIKNFTKTPINQFFPSMYKVRIDRKPSIYDFFHEEDLQQRFKRHIVRNVRMDGMYLYTKYLTNTNGQLDTDYFQKWKSGLNGNTGFYLERTDQVNNNGTTHKVYLPTKSVKKLQGQGILDDGDLRNNVDFGDDDEPSGYTVRYYDKNEKIIPNILQVFRIGLGTQPAVNFPTLSARLIYEKYLPQDQDNHIVWDCCSGYGGRLLGSLSSKLNIHYVGTEVNSSIWDNYDELGNFYNENCGGTNTWEIFKCGSEIVHKNKSFQKYKGRLDMVFSSPPYFSRELYSYDKGQSFIKFPNYRDWLTGFLGPTIKTSYEYLKPNRYMILNVSDIKMGENNFIPLEQDTIELAVKIGFSYIGRMDMTMGKMIGVKQSSVKNKYFSMDSKKTYKTEPILCFLKK